MSCVYFIKAEGMPSPIKIGFSKLVETRLLQLGKWSPFPLEVLLTIEGGEKLELQFHAKFAHLHSHHEWFRADGELVEAIEQLRAGTFDFASLPEAKRHWPNWQKGRRRSEEEKAEDRAYRKRHSESDARRSASA